MREITVAVATPPLCAVQTGKMHSGKKLITLPIIDAYNGSFEKPNARR